MIRLDLKREPHWLDLAHGVRVHVQPCTTALIMAARAKLIDADADAGARVTVWNRTPERAKELASDLGVQSAERPGDAAFAAQGGFLCVDARAIADYLGIRATDRAVTTLPLHYCYGLSVLNSHLLAGAAVVLSELSVETIALASPPIAARMSDSVRSWATS